MSTAECSVARCAESVKAKGLCALHYERTWEASAPGRCKAPQCVATTRGPSSKYCARHQRRLQRNGTLARRRRPASGLSP